MNNSKCYCSLSILLSFLFLFSVSDIGAQSDEKELIERPDDPYIYAPRDLQPKSPPYQFFDENISCVQVNVDADGNNILGDAANEPSIAIDPTDPNRMVMGWRQFDDISSNFRQAGFAFSIDGGASWTFPGPIDPGVFRSDPVLDFDSEGNFYYNSLRAESSGFWCEVFRSTGDGTWGDAIYAHGGDKQWMAIDRTGGVGEGNIYASWSIGFSACNGDFTHSVDSGDSYEECDDIPLNPNWGTLNVGPSGELYVTGNGGSVLKSTNAQNGGMIEWDLAILADLGGALQAFAGVAPNPGGLHGQQWIATDHSGGPNHGNVYILGSVGSLADPLNVNFIKSTDGGETWTPPVTINDDNSNDNWQWFGTMSVAPNGRIDVIWLDTRDNPGTFLSSLYYSFSMDGGDTWSVNKRLSEEFDPHVGWPNQEKMGDYFDMISSEEGAHLAWAGTFNGEQDVYYSFITPDEISSTHDLESTEAALGQNSPNPFSSQTTIPYQLNKSGMVELAIYNLNGERVKTLVNQKMPVGNYEAVWSRRDEQRKESPSGVYYYDLKIDGEFIEGKKMVVF